MKILIVNNSKIPALQYGGTERVIWALGKTLNALGHEVNYLVAKGSYCDFAKKIYILDSKQSLNTQIPNHIDVVHFNFQPNEPIHKPYITTFHGNVNHAYQFDVNTVFISANQAARFHSNTFVYNGLDWDDYDKPQLNIKRNFFHFLGDASWKVKNVKGAINITQQANEKLVVLGGNRLNFNMGFRFTPNLHVSFKGKVNNTAKSKWLSQSKGLIFPVLWHEPFGLSIIESLYFGCPIFATTHGSLPELVPNDVGFLSNSIHQLANALHQANNFTPKHCHNYAVDCFNANIMAKAYLQLYQQVLNGYTLHSKPPYLPDNEIIRLKRFFMDA